MFITALKILFVVMSVIGYGLYKFHKMMTKDMDK